MGHWGYWEGHCRDRDWGHQGPQKQPGTLGTPAWAEAGRGHRARGTRGQREDSGGTQPWVTGAVGDGAPRSFGVVLWELLTGEIPYKDVDSSAIIWGVGSNSLHLPVPSGCPDGFKVLLRQCW